MSKNNSENDIFDIRDSNTDDTEQMPEKTTQPCDVDEKIPEEQAEKEEEDTDEITKDLLERLRELSEMKSDDEDDDDEDDDDSCDRRHAGDSVKKVPVGKRVLLRSDYKSERAYCSAVFKSMRAVLRKNNITAMQYDLAPGVKLLTFDRSTKGVDVDCHIVCEYKRNNYRIEFRLNIENRRGRTPLIDYFCQSKNFSLCYGCLIMDHKDGEKKIEYSSSFLGSFSEEAFEHYYELLSNTLFVYVSEFEYIAEHKKLNSGYRMLARRLIYELTENFPSCVKPENQELFNSMAEALGGKLSYNQEKLLNYLIEHSN